MEKQLTTGSDTTESLEPIAPTAGSVPETQSRPDRPASIARTLTMTTVALFLSIAVTGSVARRDTVRFPGVLKAEVSRLSAPADGVVEWMDVTPGQIVLPGTELFIIRDTQLEQRIRQTENTLNGFRTDLAAAQARSELELQQRTAALESSAFDTELTLTGLLQQQFQQSFESTALGDYLNLFDALASTEIPPVNLSSLSMPVQDREYDRMRAMIERSEVENRIEALQTRIELCEGRLKELRGAIASLPEQIRAAHRIPVIQASISSTVAELDSLKTLEAERTVNSPIYGMAGVLRVQEQESVSAGDLLVEIFDRDREFVTVCLPMSLVARLDNNQKVTLHFPNDEEREGLIESVPPQLTSEDSSFSDESGCSLKIHPVGKPWPTLPIGSSLEVSLER